MRVASTPPCVATGPQAAPYPTLRQIGCSARTQRRALTKRPSREGNAITLYIYYDIDRVGTVRSREWSRPHGDK